MSVTIFGKDAAPAELRARTGKVSRLAGVTAVRYDDGPAEGIRGLEVRNGGGLGATIVPGRALDALELNWRGVPLTWMGPGGLRSPRSYVPTIEEFERSFFGGLTTTCGLTAFGPPGSDRWGSWSQHGRVNWLPAEDVRWWVDWDEPEPAISIVGTVREARMFGENLRLERRWTIPIGSQQVILRDRVTNDGGRSEPHMILYHCNAGYPLLDTETVWTVSHETVRPRDDRAAEGIDVWNRGGPPSPDFREQVYIHEPASDEHGWAFAAASNAALFGGVTLRIRYRPAQLPALFTWRMLGHGTYVMAAEPANCATVEGRKEAERRGTLPMLEPGETRDYELRFEVDAGRA